MYKNTKSTKMNILNQFPRLCFQSLNNYSNSQRTIMSYAQSISLSNTVAAAVLCYHSIFFILIPQTSRFLSLTYLIQIWLECVIYHTKIKQYLISQNSSERDLPVKIMALFSIMGVFVCVLPSIVWSICFAKSEKYGN